MHQGNWKCSSCGGTITELPFEPRSESGLVCRTCYSKQKGNQQAPELPVADEAPSIPEDAGLASEPAPDESPESRNAIIGERPKFSGEWTCSGCGGPISSLPFEPSRTDNLKCLDCFKKSKGN